MGFDSLVYAFHPPLSLEDSVNFHVSWKEVNTFTRRINIQEMKINSSKSEEYGMSLVQLLKLQFCFENLDSLSKGQFYDYFYALDFLQGGKHGNKIQKMIKLNDAFQDTLSNSDLEYFASQNQEFLQVLLHILTPDSFSVDMKQLRLRFSQDIRSIIHKILERLVQRLEVPPFSQIKKYEFSDFNTFESTQTLIFKILKKNANNLTLLKIHAYEFHCPCALVFPNIQNLSIRILFRRTLKMKFLLHSQYKSLRLYHNVEIESLARQKYFEFCQSKNEDISPVLELIKQNKDLSVLALNLFEFSLYPFCIPCKETKALKLALNSLKDLKSFESSSALSLDMVFNYESSLETLKISDYLGIHWNSLAQKLTNLKHFSTPCPALEEFE